MIQLRIARAGRPTGELLHRLLMARELSVSNSTNSISGMNRRGCEVTGVVCWGLGYQGDLPALNKAHGTFNKLQQLQHLEEGTAHEDENGIIPFFTEPPTEPRCYPLLGRKLHHSGGVDIKVYLQPEDALVGHRNHVSDFYTKYIPRQTEYRVWVYRRKHLRTYEKVLLHPEQYHGQIGANADNGYGFVLLPQERLRQEAIHLAATAVDKLGLDFGAVDILRASGTGYFYLLEVNTAPGVEGPREGLVALADKIKKWVDLGFPRRRGDSQ